ncbi:MAG: ABC transporter ATP-binding protein [archaeon YNP-WB-062]|nr:ABC transporter ATP-binding protein [Candidatus Culexarchaeum yellowstonense]
MEQTKLVLTDRITKIYPNGIKANENVSIHVNRGETVCITGPNGAGKTTLVRQIMGLLRPTSGTVRVLGHDPLKKISLIKREVGYVPQAPLFFPANKVREVVDFVASTSKASDNKEQLFKLLGLESTKELMGYQLSLGQRKLLLFMLALIKNPSILVLDEPTVLVDIVNKHNMWEVMVEIKREKKGILLVSHDIEEIRRLCDRIYVMVNGRVVFEGDIHEVSRTLSSSAELKIFTSEYKRLRGLLKGTVISEGGEMLTLSYNSLREALEDLQLIASSDIIGNARLILEYPSIDLSIMRLFGGRG